MPNKQVLIGTKAEIEAGTADSVTITAVNSDSSITVSASITVAEDDLIVSK